MERPLAAVKTETSSLALSQEVFPSDLWEILDDGNANSRQVFLDSALQFISSPGVHHPCCKNERLITEIIDSLHLVYPAIGAAVSSCRRCSRSYYNAKKAVLEECPFHLSAPGAVDRVLQQLFELDVSRIALDIEAALTDSSKLAGILNEVLNNPELMTTNKVLDPFTNLLLSLFEEGEFELSSLPPGLCLLLFHRDEPIRAWAHQSVAKFLSLQDSGIVGLRSMKFILEFLLGWVQEYRASGSKDPTASKLKQLLPIGSDEFWDAMFILFDNLSDEDYDDFLPNGLVFAPSGASTVAASPAGSDSESQSQDSSISTNRPAKVAHHLDNVVGVLHSLNKRGYEFKLLEFFMTRFSPPHTFWMKTRLVPSSLAKMISKEFERSTTDEDRSFKLGVIDALVGSISQSNHRKNIMDPAIQEIITLISVKIQNSPDASEEIKMRAALILTRVIKEWRKNPLYYQRGQGGLTDPVLTLQDNWVPMLIRCFLTTCPAVLDEDKIEVARVIHDLLIHDAAIVERVTCEFLASINRIATGSQSDSSSQSQSLGTNDLAQSLEDPATLKVTYLKRLWFYLTVESHRINDTIHAALIQTFRDLAMFDLDYCGGINTSNLPKEWKECHEYLSKVLADFREYAKAYFTCLQTNKTKLPPPAFASAIYPLLAIAPDSSPVSSQISAQFKVTLRIFSGAQTLNQTIAQVLKNLASGPDGVDLVRGLKLLFQQIAQRNSAKFTFYSWNWACLYFYQLISAVPDGAEVFLAKLEALENKEKELMKSSAGVATEYTTPFWEYFWRFCRYVLKFGAQHSQAPGSKLESSMISFFDLFTFIIKRLSHVNLIHYYFLLKHPTWFADLMSWSNSSSAILKRWCECVVELIKSLRTNKVPMSEMFLLAVQNAVRDPSLGEGRILLANLVPTEGVGNLGLKSPLADLPKRSTTTIQTSLPFAQTSTSSPTKLPPQFYSKPQTKPPVIDLDSSDDDIDDVDNARPVSRATPSKRLDDFFNSQKSADQYAKEKNASYTSKSDQRNANTLALLSGWGPLSFEGAAANNSARAVAPGVPKLSTPTNTVRRNLPLSLTGRAPIPQLVRPKPAQPISTGMTAAQRKEELEKQRAFEGHASRKAVKVVLEDDNSALDRLKRLERDAAEAKRRRLMAPTIDDLIARITSWSMSSISMCNNPPDKDFELPTSGIPLQFKDVDTYISIFQPLLIMEFWSQIKQSIDEVSSSGLKMAMLPGAASNQGKFHNYVFGRMEHQFQQNDLVVVTPYLGSTAPAVAGQQPVHVLAKVQKIGPEGKQFPGALHIKCMFYLMDDKSSRIDRMRRTLASNKAPSYEIKKLANMTTMIREYQALNRLANIAKSPNNPFIASILRPCSVKPENTSLAYDPYLLSYFQKKGNFNRQQLAAIEEATKSTGYTLIQGPPGTGKTKTIVGLISTLLDAYRKPILVCAPSNAAVDEIVSRLLDGIPTMRRNPEKFTDKDEPLSEPRTFKPRVVRVVLGQAAAKIRADVEAVTLERLIQRQIERENKEVRTAEDLAAAQEIMDELARDTKAPAVAREVPLKDQRVKRDERTRKNELKYSIIAEAQIVCATLSTSSRKMIRERWFSSVIIDEAAQAVELSTIIPLTDKTTRCIMVGDPNQLPATVLSKEARNLQYEQSLFQRMMMNNYPSTMLTTQYRMHPEIRVFPSFHFYENRLEDGDQDCNREWHSVPIFSPMVFFDLQSAYQQGSKSLSNRDEATFILQLLRLLKQAYPPEGELKHWVKRIGVISPYLEQRNLLINTLGEFAGLEIGTVDGFQGREKDIIILSTVRSSTRGVGFLADVRRLNVALTRAKSSIWIVGNSSALCQNTHWNALINHIKPHEGRYHAIPNISKFFDEWNVSVHRYKDRSLHRHHRPDAPKRRDSGLGASSDSNVKKRKSDVMPSSSSSSSGASRFDPNAMDVEPITQPEDILDTPPPKRPKINPAPVAASRDQPRPAQRVLTSATPAVVQSKQSVAPSAAPKRPTPSPVVPTARPTPAAPSKVVAPVQPRPAPPIPQPPREQAKPLQMSASSSTTSYNAAPKPSAPAPQPTPAPAPSGLKRPGNAPPPPAAPAKKEAPKPAPIKNPMAFIMKTMQAPPK